MSDDDVIMSKVITDDVTPGPENAKIWRLMGHKEFLLKLNERISGRLGISNVLKP